MPAVTNLSLLSYNMLGVLVVVGTLKLIEPHQYPQDLLRFIGKKLIFRFYFSPSSKQGMSDFILDDNLDKVDTEKQMEKQFPCQKSLFPIYFLLRYKKLYMILNAQYFSVTSVSTFLGTYTPKYLSFVPTGIFTSLCISSYCCVLNKTFFLHCTAHGTQNIKGC